MMVNASGAGKHRSPDSGCQFPADVKVEVEVEVEDSLDDEHGPLCKRFRFCPSGPTAASSSSPLDVYQSVLNEPSPLGLKLRKSPSLLDLIQMKLAGKTGSDAGERKEAKSSATPAAAAAVPAASNASSERLKASNFPAKSLHIGNWEYVSTYEGDLVAKCYYAKHKLVWEVLENGLKSKIEFQWSDIASIKAFCPEDGLGILHVVLSRPPLFFRETDPQPRKHTLWQATTDFTGGQASANQTHVLQCPSALLSKNFEKLIQCDIRLNLLSQQSNISLDSHYFPKPSSSGFEDLKTDYCGPASSEYLSNPSSSEEPPEFLTPSIYSAEPERARSQSFLDELKRSGIHRSMSRDDLLKHLEHHLCDLTIKGGAGMPGGNPETLAALNEIAEHLLGDTQASSVSDECTLMQRVQSFYRLIDDHGKPPIAEHLLGDTQASSVPDEGTLMQRVQSFYRLIDDHGKPPIGQQLEPASYDSSESSDEDAASTEKQQQEHSAMRKDPSYGQLLERLPRVASNPCLFIPLVSSRRK